MVADASEKSATPAAGLSPQIARTTPSFTPPGRVASVSGDEGRRLVVGRDIVLSGSIQACEDLVVEGRVEAELSESKRIEVTETGTFKGAVEIDDAVIAGIFEGDLTVRDRLTVKGTGQVRGKIRYGELEIQTGGRVIGDIDLFDAGAGSTGSSAQIVGSDSSVADER